MDFGALAGLQTRAAIRLGQLDGIVDTLPNPAILNRAFARREALTSSRMEGTVTSIEELVQYEVNPDDSMASAQTREVQNYDNKPVCAPALHRLSHTSTSCST